MKLLFVIHQYFPDCHSGTEQYCLAVSREARRRGDEVVVLSLEPDYNRRDPHLVVFDRPYDGFTVLRLRYWGGIQPNEVLRDYENPIAAAKFSEVLDSVQPEAIHFFHLRYLGSDFLDVACDRGIRTVVNLMDFWYVCPRFTLLRSDGELCEGPPDHGRGCVACAYPELESLLDDPSLQTEQLAKTPDRVPSADTPTDRFVALMQRKPVLLQRLARVDHVIAPSRFLADMFKKNGFEHDQVHVVPYGLEPNRVKRMPVVRPRSPLRVGFAGVFSPWKGAHVLVDAALRIEEQIELTLHGRTEEFMFQSYIDAQVLQPARDDDRIRFPGPFGHGELDQVMADMDVLVVPSLWYENTPFVVLEAFEAGVPVIASELGGISEIVEEGVNGYLFPPGDAAALAQVLRACILDPSRISSLKPELPGGVASNYDVFIDCYR